MIYCENAKRTIITWTNNQGSTENLTVEAGNVSIEVNNYLNYQNGQAKGTYKRASSVPEYCGLEEHFESSKFNGIPLGIINPNHTGGFFYLDVLKLDGSKTTASITYGPPNYFPIAGNPLNESDLTIKDFQVTEFNNPFSSLMKELLPQIDLGDNEVNIDDLTTSLLLGFDNKLREFDLPLIKDTVTNISSEISLEKIGDKVKEKLCQETKPGECLDPVPTYNKIDTVGNRLETLLDLIEAYQQQQQGQLIQEIRDAIFDEDCGLEAICEELHNCYPLLPEWWQIRLGNNVPQLVVGYQEVNTKSRWALTIPHWVGSTNDVLLIPSYTKGLTITTLILNDNSKLIINAVSATEGERVINTIVNANLIDSNFLVDAQLIFNGERRGTPLKIANIIPKVAKYFSTGQRNLQPDWVVKFDENN